MKITFLGTGTSFTLENFQSNMLIETSDKQANKMHLLLDCGCDIRHSLNAAGFTFLDIEAVFISHLHSDHIGGLGWLCASTFYDENYKGKPTLLVAEMLSSDLWEKSLRGGLNSANGQTANLETYFTVKKLKLCTSIKFHNLKLKPIKTIHCRTENEIEPSFGLTIITENNKKVFVTTDTQFLPDIFADIYADADVIFHDCETSAKKSGVHAHFEELSTLSSEIKAKMFLYHYQDGKLPDAKNAGFAGFVKKGQSFDF